MKKWISGLLSLVLVLTLFSPITLTAFAEGGSIQSGKVNYSAVNLRQSPWGNILGLIYQGTSVEVLGSQKDSDGNIWYEVNANSKRGYMFANYIDLDKTESNTKDDKLEGFVKVSWDFARVRSTPWGTILGQLNRGQSTEVIAKTKDSDGATWYKVKFDGNYGYMHESNITYTAASAPAPKPEKPTIKEDSITGSLKVTWDFARVRTTPWGTILGQLNYGKTAVVSAKTKDSDGATWYKIKFDGKDGYMHESNVTYTAASVPAPKPEKPTIKEDSITGSLKVTWDFARVRATPWGTILGQLNYGKTAQVTAKTKDSDGAIWYKIKFDGKDGYMHQDNVAFTSSSSSDSTGSGYHNTAYGNELMALINQYRVNNGRPPLTVTSGAQADADYSSKKISENGYNHTGRDTNIAWGYNSPASVLNGWITSPAHNRGLLNYDFTEGAASCWAPSSGMLCWTFSAN